MLGIDIGEKLIKIVELKDSPQGATLNNFVTIDISPNQDLAKSITTAIKKLGFKDKEAVTSISGPNVQARRISLPAMPEAELREAVKWEAKNFVPFPIENAVIDYYPLERTGEKTKKIDLIAVAIEKATFSKRVSLIEKAGLKCEGVSISPFATLELIHLSSEVKKNDLIALIDIGEKYSHLCLFKNSTLLFIREITFAGDNITKALAKDLNLDLATAEKLKMEYGLPDEGEVSPTPQGIPPIAIRNSILTILDKLLYEISSSFDYYQEHYQGEKISKIFVSGGSSMLKNIDKYFSDNLGLPIFCLADAMKKITLNPKLDGNKLKAVLPRLTLAIGLALNKGKTMNLLKIQAKKREIKAPTNLDQILDRFKISNTLLIALVAFIITGLVWSNLYLDSLIKQAKKELNVESLKLNQIVRFRDRNVAFGDIAGKEINLKQLLARINSLMPKNLSLQYLKFDKEKRTVELGGESKNPQTASTFVNKVENSHYFSNVKLMEIRKIGDISMFRMGFKIN